MHRICGLSAMILVVVWSCTSEAGHERATVLGSIGIGNEMALEMPLPTHRSVADTAHSSVSFRTMHFEIVELMGWFDSYRIIMHSDRADFSDAVIEAEVDVRSLHMPNKRMMGSAKKLPYLDGADHPVMHFKSSSFKPLTDSTYVLDGMMRINGIERPMHFDVDFHGFAYPGERYICGFTAIGHFDRHAFNVATDDKLHSGRLIHPDRIDLRISVRME